MAKRPEDRFQSPAELVAALEPDARVRSLSPSALPGLVTASPAAARPGRRAWILLTGGAGLLFSVLALSRLACPGPAVRDTTGGHVPRTEKPPNSPSGPRARRIAVWEGDGDARDSAGARHGKLVGGAAFAEGYKLPGAAPKKAFDLNGKTAFVEVPAHDALAPPRGLLLEVCVFARSFSAFAQPGDVRAARAIISKYESSRKQGVSWHLSVLGRGRAHFAVYGYAGEKLLKRVLLSDGAALKTGVWHRIVARFEAPETMTLEVDGAPVKGSLILGSDPVASIHPAQGVAVRIGAMVDVSGRPTCFWDGLIGDVHLSHP
jgi:hypothetical protein